MAKTIEPTNDLSAMRKLTASYPLRFHQWSTGTYGYMAADKVNYGGVDFQPNVMLFLVGTKGSPAGQTAEALGLPPMVPFGDLGATLSSYINPDTQTRAVRAVGKVFPASLGHAKCQLNAYFWQVGSSPLSAEERKAISARKAEIAKAAREAALASK